VSVPAPDLVSPPVPDITPCTVVVPVVTFIIPPPDPNVTALPVPIVKVAVVCKVDPLLIVISLAVLPRRVSVLMLRVPWFMVMGEPLKVLTPVKVNVPAPVFVSAPAPDITPATVVVPVVVSNVPPPALRVIALPAVMVKVAVVCKVPLLKAISLFTLPKLALVEMLTVPPFILIGVPEKVFVPVRVNVPAPVFVKAPVPDSTP